MLAAMMSGRAPIGESAVAERAARAESAPLGSAENPVRAEAPQGQRAYLSRLRCSDGSAPMSERRGNLGPGLYGSFVDLYMVRCAQGVAPGQVEVIMDMYHRGHIEQKPIPGFTIVAEDRPTI
jgi:hypothetical protein